MPVVRNTARPPPAFKSNADCHDPIDVADKIIIYPAIIKIRVLPVHYSYADCCFLCRFEQLFMKKYLCLFICILFLHNTICAQTIPDSLVIEASSIKDSSSISRSSYIFIDSTGDAKLDNVAGQHFIHYIKYSKPSRRYVEGCIIRPFYLKFSCRNTSAVNVQLFFYPGTLYSKVKLYRLKNGTELLPVSQKGNKEEFQSLVLEPNSETEFIAQLQHDRSGGSRINPQLINKAYLNTYKAVHYDESSDLKIVGFIFSGLVLMMVIFMGTNFLLNRRKEFLYNCIYSLCMFFLVFGYSILSKVPTFITSLFYSYLDLVLLMVGLIFYIAFTRKFLNTKLNYPTLNKIFRVEEWALILLLVFYSFIHFFTPYFRAEWWLENIMKFIALGIGIVYIFISIAQRNKLLNYLAAGNAFSIIFSSIALALILFREPVKGLLTSSLFYTEVGIVLELSFFLYGLAYKNRAELIERTRMEEAIKLESEKQTFEKQLAVLQAQQAERNRISLDMHDDLGSGMTAIRLYSELAKKKITGPVPEIEKISSSADELINKMNAIIWTMSSSNDTLGNLVAYIRSYALGYLEDKGINCIIEADSKNPNIPVPGPFRRNVYLIVKETLNNILKHANATTVHISYTENEGLFKLSIQDDGIGINMDNLREFGNGLKSMKDRAESIGCKYSISNHNGTCTTLEFLYDFSRQRSS